MCRVSTGVSLLSQGSFRTRIGAFKAAAVLVARTEMETDPNMFTVPHKKFQTTYNLLDF